MYTTLSVVTPPAAEPVTVDLARRHCRVDNTDDDDLILLYVAVARSLAENYTARAFAPQQLRYAISHSPPGAQWPLTAMAPVIQPLWLPFPLAFRAPIQLPRFPVRSIDRVAVSHAGQLLDTVLDAATQYTSDLTAAPARLLLAPSAQPQLGQHVLVDFSAGYDPDVEAVPQLILHAILFGAAWLYEHRGDDDGAALPEAFYALLTPYRLVNGG